MLATCSAGAPLRTVLAKSYDIRTLPHDQCLSAVYTCMMAASISTIFNDVQEAIEQVLSLDRDLNYVHLAFRRIGSARSPFWVGKKTLGLVQVKTVHLSGPHGCHVQVDREAALAWKNFSIHTSEEASLDFGGYPNMKFIEGLQDFDITCRYGAVLAHSLQGA
jgi:hypothetical protein